jgi:hypothetical protein
LEKFDAKSDLGLVGGENAIKTFEYTYLGKAPGEVKSVPFELSYFDPETNRYETFKQEIPSLKVAGIANPTVAPMRDQKNEKQEVSDLKEKSDAPVELQSVAWWSQMGFWWSLLAGVLILVAAWKGRDLVASIKSNETWIQEIKTMQHQQVSNSSLLKVFYHLAKGENDNLEKIIQSSNLSEQTKSYYLDIVQKLMRQEYGKESGVQVLRLEGKYARELKKEIRRKYADS